MYSSKKKVVIIVMCVMMVFMAIGYAVLSTNLNIKGTSNLTGTWGIRIDSVTSTPTGRAYNISNPTYTDTNMTFNVGVKEPGDKMTFSVVLKNYGSIAAIVDDIEASSSGSPVIKYSISGIKKGDKLSGYSSITLTIVTEFDIDATEIPVSPTKTLNIKLSFVQDDGQTITGDNPTIDEKVVKVYGKPDAIGTDMQIGNEHFYVISSDSTKVVALARYNLDLNVGEDNYYQHTYKGTGLQNANVTGYYGSAAYVNYYGDSTNYDSTYWSSTCSSYPCDTVFSYASSYGWVRTYQAYLENTLKANIQKARLITYDELSNLGCITATCTSATAPYWLFNTTYWTSTASSNTQIYVISDFGRLSGVSYSLRGSVGIRPVIEVNKSDIEYINVKPKANGDITKVGTDIQIGDEHFYVISSDSTKVVAFAKYNLDIRIGSYIYKGSSKQEERLSENYSTTKGLISYLDSATCTSYPCEVYNSSGVLGNQVERYRTYLQNMGVKISKARFITYDELISLGCYYDAEVLSCAGSNAPGWTYNTAYWTSTATDSSHVWYLLNTGVGQSISTSTDGVAGIRPVIEIPRSEFS